MAAWPNSQQIFITVIYQRSSSILTGIETLLYRKAWDDILYFSLFVIFQRSLFNHSQPGTNQCAGISTHQSQTLITILQENRLKVNQVMNQLTTKQSTTTPVIRPLINIVNFTKRNYYAAVLYFVLMQFIKRTKAHLLSKFLITWKQTDRQKMKRDNRHNISKRVMSIRTVQGVRSENF
jgi:hypothetical protein